MCAVPLKKSLLELTNNTMDRFRRIRTRILNDSAHQVKIFITYLQIYPIIGTMPCVRGAQERFHIIYFTNLRPSEIEVIATLDNFFLIDFPSDDSNNDGLSTGDNTNDKWTD